MMKIDGVKRESSPGTPKRFAGRCCLRWRRIARRAFTFRAISSAAAGRASATTISSRPCPTARNARNVDGSTQPRGVLRPARHRARHRLAPEDRARRAPGDRPPARAVHRRAAAGRVEAHTQMGGYTTGAAARQSMTSGTVYAGGVPVCHASGTFMVLPPPPGVNLAPLPWQRESGEPAAPLKSKDLEPDERAVLRACNSALRRADDQRAFIEHFWGVLPVQTGTGSRCTVKTRPAARQSRRPCAGRPAAGARGDYRARRGAAAPPALRHRGLVHQSRPGPGAEDHITTVPRRPQLRRGAHRDPQRGWVAVLEVVSHHAS